MKTVALTVAILACLATLGQMQTTAAPPATTPHAPPATTPAPPATTAAPPATTHAPPAPTTQPPPAPTTQPPTTKPPGTKPPIVPTAPPAITLKQIQDRMMADPALAGLVNKVTKIQKEVAQTEKVFEMDISIRNITLLKEIMDKCKAIRQSETAPTLIEIQEAIASIQPRTFLNRLLLEGLRIQTQSYEKVLKWIGNEILGDLSDVARFENYYYSETVAIARELLISRYLDMLVSSYEVDIILDAAYKKDPTTLHIDAATKTQVDKHLKDILAAANVVKQEITKDYYSEVERIRLDGRELNLLQRQDMEMNIDLLNDAVNFVTKYEELFLRINA